MAADPTHGNTLPLLQRWHEGDRSALDRLLERDLPWIRGFVERRLGDLLRRKADTDDYVQDALLDVLRYTPRFLVEDRRQFRALLGRICENTIRDRLEHHRAQKRDVAREREVPSDSVLPLDPTARQVTRVSVAVDRNADQQWLRLALELLEPDARRLVLLRDWERLSFAEIAAELSLSEDAARMRYHRILPTLALRVEDLRRGDLDRALRPTFADEAPAADDLPPATARPRTPALELPTTWVTAGCWALLERASGGDLPARKLYLRLFTTMLLPAIQAALGARWGAAAPAHDRQAVLRALTERLLQGSADLDARGRAQGLPGHVEQLLQSAAEQHETAADHPTAVGGQDCGHAAFDTAWATAVVNAAIHLHGERAIDSEPQFRAELLRLHLGQHLSFDTLAQRWAIDGKALALEFATASQELAAVLSEFVRFCFPDHLPAELQAESARLLATTAGAALRTT